MPQNKPPDLWHNHSVTENLTDNSLADLWEKLLSQDPRLIRETFNLLGKVERQAVEAHLKRMCLEAGWLPQQQESAEAALIVIQKEYNQKD